MTQPTIGAIVEWCPLPTCIAAIVFGYYDLTNARARFIYAHAWPRKKPSNSCQLGPHPRRPLINAHYITMPPNDNICTVACIYSGSFTARVYLWFNQYDHTCDAPWPRVINFTATHLITGGEIFDYITGNVADLPEFQPYPTMRKAMRRYYLGNK